MQIYAGNCMLASKIYISSILSGVIASSNSTLVLIIITYGQSVILQ